jgi:hypothetical protein
MPREKQARQNGKSSPKRLHFARRSRFRNSVWNGALKGAGRTDGIGIAAGLERAAMHMRNEYFRMSLLPQAPLARLLLINLAIGAVVTLLLVGGLLALNPGGLRDLIFADRSPGVALALLLMSFFITFGSTAMGTAIMALGRREEREEPPRGRGRLAMQRLIGKGRW